MLDVHLLVETDFCSTVLQQHSTAVVLCFCLRNICFLVEVGQIGQQAAGAPPVISAITADPEDGNFVGQVNSQVNIEDGFIILLAYDHYHHQCHYA